jgi:D-sedoheptulose 7-phosphate isomerase
MSDLIERVFAETRQVQTAFFERHRTVIVAAAEAMTHAIRQGHKVLLFGNGGSAADAQHIAAELVGRFGPNRRPVPALSLSTDTSLLTALANDFGYSAVFVRQIEAFGEAGDIAIGISTSGNSANVVTGLEVARANGLRTVGFTGEDGGRMVNLAEFLFRVPSKKTPRIQETHIVLGHLLCELVDRSLFPEAYAEN